MDTRRSPHVLTAAAGYGLGAAMFSALPGAFPLAQATSSDRRLSDVLQRFPTRLPPARDPNQEAVR